jgi:hypothetical protein
MKSYKMRTAILPALLLLAMALAPAVARASAAQKPVTREEVQMMLSRVGQEMWHAELSSAMSPEAEEEWIHGEHDFFRKNYAGAMKHLKAADKAVQGLPNDWGNE